MFRHYKRKSREMRKYTELTENENMTYRSLKSTVC